jgi:predicted TPR repeat methyltransferase
VSALTSTPVLSLEGDFPTALVQQWRGEDAAFARRLKLGTSVRRALEDLGVRLCLGGRHGEAVEVLRAAVSMGTGGVGTRNNLAVALERGGWRAEAAAEVERSLAEVPGQHDSWVFLGNLKRELGDLEGAAAAFQAAISLEESSQLGWQGLGLVRQVERRHAEAIDCLLASIGRGQPTAPILAVLGQLFYSTGQFVKSRRAYSAAAEMDPGAAMYRQMLRETEFLCAAMDGAEIGGAVAAYEGGRAAWPGEAHKGVEALLHSSFSLLGAYGHAEAARRVAEARARMFPGNATAAYLLHAIDGDATVARSPDDYLVEHFDALAANFDRHLVGTLGYDVPEKIGRSLRERVPAGSRLDVLDAGCGTGLCGPEVRGIAATLTGVDVSGEMVARARERGTYDRLVCGELTSFLMGEPGAFDVVVAADVIIYFGDLAPLAGALAGAIRPGGLLVFSTERAASGGHVLLSSGRFAHDPAYVRGVFGGAFEAVAARETTIRLEGQGRVAGDIFTFRRLA